MQIGKFLTAAGCPSRIARRVALGSLMTFLFSGAACPSTVKVPGSADQDQAPTIRIGYAKFTATPTPEAGDFKYATQSGTVLIPGADWGNNHMIIADASNPKGGVKELKLVVGRVRQPQQTVTNSQAIGSDGTALPSLSIPGTNGQGGIGQQPILLRFSNTDLFEAIATATNFNGQTTSVTVVFDIDASPPIIHEFSVTPNDNHPDLGYINAGSTATLKWRVQCGSGVIGCKVELRGADGEPQYANQILYLHSLGFTGTFNVTPKQKSKYTLTVTNVGGGNRPTSKTIQVSIYNPPPMSDLRPFYFKMSCNSAVTPCFTLLIYANDEAQAKQLAEFQNIGCTATAVSAQEFENGCR